MHMKNYIFAFAIFRNIMHLALVFIYLPIETPDLYTYLEEFGRVFIHQLKNSQNCVRDFQYLASKKSCLFKILPEKRIVNEKSL
jgi:hypothetical protein